MSLKDMCRTVRVDCYLQVKELAQRQHVKLDIRYMQTKQLSTCIYLSNLTNQFPLNNVVLVYLAPIILRYPWHQHANQSKPSVLHL
jgi:hypothetical protein